jgi:branched-chain amino acid transport system substrate-binding protein
MKTISKSRNTRRHMLVAVFGLSAAVSVLGMTALSVAQDAKEPVIVGIITSTTGSYSSQGESFLNGFNAGLDFVSNGTGIIAGHKIDVRVSNDNGNPATGTAAARELMGSGAKFLTGPTNSAVALPVSEIATRNGGSYLSGASGSSALLASDHNVFVTGAGSWLPNEAIFKVVPDAKKIVFIGQDYQYGKDQVDLLTNVGKKFGVEVASVLLPPTTQDFTGGVLELQAAGADVVFVGWQGNGTAQLYQSLTDMDVFQTSQVVTILSSRWAVPTFLQAAGEAAGKTIVLTPYFEGLAGRNLLETHMIDYAKKTNVTVDYVHPQGFIAAQMIARAVEESGGDPSQEKVAAALEGWTFDSPFGELTIRPEDHLITAPMYSVNFSMEGNSAVAKLLRTFPGAELAPPVAKSLK